MATFDAENSRQAARILPAVPARRDTELSVPAGDGAHRAQPPVVIASRRQRHGGLVWFALGIGIAYAGYFVLRYGGLWTENDTSVFIQDSVQTIQHGTVLYYGQYAHGFGYSGWLSSLSLLTGISPAVMNTVFMPFIGMVLFIVPAFLAFRTLLGSESAGLLTVVLFLAVPDLLFSLLRGNHEKLNISITLLALWVLFRGFEAMGRGSATRMAIWVVTFYLLMTVNATVNDFFASTFVTACTLTLLTCAWLVAYRSPLGAKRQAMFRFALTVSVSWLLMWWVVLFVFPPAGKDFQLITSTQGKLRSLFLTFQTSSNPYSIAQQQWSGTFVYYALSSFRYVILVGSLIVFTVKMWNVIVNKRHLSLERLMLLALYGGFGFLVVVSIPVDLAGLAAGSNLQYRNFTYFILLATPIFAWGMRDSLVWFMQWRRRKASSSNGGARGRPRSTRLVVGLTGVLLGVFVVLGIAKCTVDPIVSNQRIYYTSAERQAVTYFANHAPSDVLWSGPDNSLTALAATAFPSRPTITTQVEGYTVQPFMRDWLKSPQVLTNALAYSFRLPDYSSQNRVYDNGSAQIYRVAPPSRFGS